MYNIDRLLVALDLTEMDDTLIRYTSFIAKLFKADKVYFFHVADSYDLPEEVRKNYPDLYSRENKTGGSVKKSVEFMLPYARGEKVYPQWTNSKVEFDRTRYLAGDDKYKPGTAWDPTSGLSTYLYAQFFDSRFIEIIAKANNSRNKEYPSWETVLAKVIDLKVK